MERIHKKGYLHLDIKRDNIMVGKNNKVHLIDYGLAERFELEDGTHRPNLGQMHGGNIHYASPNNFRE